MFDNIFFFSKTEKRTSYYTIKLYEHLKERNDNHRDNI